MFLLYALKTHLLNHYCNFSSDRKPQSHRAAVKDDAKRLPRIVVISASTDPRSDLLNAPLWTSASSWGSSQHRLTNTREDLMKTMFSTPSIKDSLTRSLHLKSLSRLVSCWSLSSGRTCNHQLYQEDPWKTIGRIRTSHSVPSSIVFSYWPSVAQFTWTNHVSAFSHAQPVCYAWFVLPRRGRATVVRRYTRTLPAEGPAPLSRTASFRLSFLVLPSSINFTTIVIITN